MQLRKIFIAIVSAVALAALTGCASLPSPEVMKAETATFQLPQRPESGKALVYVVRPSMFGAAIRFNVFVDDQEAASEMGFTRGKQYIYFNVTPGEHKIYSKAENWAEAKITAKAGDTIFIQQEPSTGFVIARNSITTIEELPGKYHVSKLAPGTVIKSNK